MADLGIDIGASKVYFIALEGNNLVSEGRFDLTPQSPEKILEACGQIKANLKEKRVHVERAAIGVPGLPKGGTLNYAPNFPKLVGYPLTQEIGKIFSVPVVLRLSPSDSF